MVRFMGLVLAALLALGSPAAALADDIVVPAVDTPWPGKIFVGHDEWVLSDSAFRMTPNDAGALARNVASWFTRGHAGRFLVYSRNPGLRGGLLASAMRNAGHTWTVNADIPFTLPTLSQYDAVFLAGDKVDTSVLIDYVRAGGNVFLLGGSGIGGVSEAARWNVFLNAFGLNMETRPDTTRAPGMWAVSSASPLFSGVTRTYEQTGNALTRLDPADGTAQILVWSDQARGRGIFAIYETPVIAVPVEICPTRVNVRSPHTLTVSIAGSAGVNVTAIDPGSIQLLGAPAQSVDYAYSVATRPGVRLLGLVSLLDCGAQQPDQHLDLILTFDSRAVVQGIEHALGRSVRDDELIALTLIGQLKPEHGGTPIVGEALIEINKPRLLGLF